MTFAATDMKLVIITARAQVKQKYLRTRWQKRPSLKFQDYAHAYGDVLWLYKAYQFAVLPSLKLERQRHFTAFPEILEIMWTNFYQLWQISYLSSVKHRDLTFTSTSVVCNSCYW